ncbi:outer membrane beta-barrel protein [Hymenobacter cheonanensis]|uniref:outer membrane beta-barrel protein n=1 Tax=Hymenobacter sp. CA2-7 TaxID=3063993 RepID=UPI0027127DD9|nr:outer membrane beta-barrel protein [Hymenobacter sp. CA2-7]MDO7884462.1 outer membrane beta-barrel protein [Hymenobacter sp. CA2-7]
MRKKLLLTLSVVLTSLAALAQTTETTTAQRPAPADTATANVPFAGMDLSWVNGQNRQQYFPLQFQDKAGETVLTATALLDGYYNYNFARPLDHTQTISAVTGRAQEFSLALASIGIESNYKNIIGRLWLQTGSMLNVVQETDASVLRGRNTGTTIGANGTNVGTGITGNNLKYIREAAAGYHFNVAYGLNLELGIFMSYIGLESYVTQENWSYQRSLVCDFTPFYFQGARAQFYPSRKFKTELWVMNGWQTYNTYNKRPALGNSNYFRPSENVQLVANFYVGNDTRPGLDSLAIGRAAYPNITRFHHDNSVVARYYHKDKKGPLRGITQAAFSLNTHYGFQSGTDAGGHAVQAKNNYMVGSSLAHRLWFAKNKLAVTTRVGFVKNPSRYLSFTPSVVGFTDTDASRLTAKEATVTFDVMPSDYVTFRLEYLHRSANVPYFAGPGGTTSPSGYADQPLPAGYVPDLRDYENRLIFAVNFRL